MACVLVTSAEARGSAGLPDVGCRPGPAGLVDHRALAEIRNSIAPSPLLYLVLRPSSSGLLALSRDNTRNTRPRRPRRSFGSRSATVCEQGQWTALAVYERLTSSSPRGPPRARTERVVHSENRPFAGQTVTLVHANEIKKFNKKQKQKINMYETSRA